MEGQISKQNSRWRLIVYIRMAASISQLRYPEKRLGTLDTCLQEHLVVLNVGVSQKESYKLEIWMEFDYIQLIILLL